MGDDEDVTEEGGQNECRLGWPIELVRDCEEEEEEEEEGVRLLALAALLDRPWWTPIHPSKPTGLPNPF